MSITLSIILFICWSITWFIVIVLYYYYDSIRWEKETNRELKTQEYAKRRLKILELVERHEQEEWYSIILEQLEILNKKYRHKITEEQLWMITCKEYNNLSREKIQEIVNIPMEHLLIYGCILPRDTRLRTQKLLRP